MGRLRLKYHSVREMNQHYKLYFDNNYESENNDPHIKLNFRILF